MSFISVALSRACMACFTLSVACTRAFVWAPGCAGGGRQEQLDSAKLRHSSAKLCCGFAEGLLGARARSVVGDLPCAPESFLGDNRPIDTSSGTNGRSTSRRR